MVRDDSKDTERLIAAHRVAIKFYRADLLLRPSGWAARHLRSRRMTHLLDGGSGWNVGYAPDAWAHLVDHLRSNGFDDRTMIASGLAVATRDGYLIDRFRDRIMFPVYNGDLEPVGFVSRGRGGPAKHLNTSTTQIYQKAASLYGLAEQHQVLAIGAVPVLTEGPFDAHAVSSCSRTISPWVGIGLGGTSLSAQQIAMIRHFSFSDTVIVALDGDASGRVAAVRRLGALQNSFRHVLVADLPDGEDPSALFRSGNGPSRLHAQLDDTRPLASLAIELELGRWTKVLDHLSGRVGALRAVAPFVSRLPSTLVADEVVRLSRMLSLDASTVSREVLASVGKAPTRSRPALASGLAPGSDPPALSLGL